MKKKKRKVKKKVKQRTQVRRFTAGDIQNIRNLADMLGKLVPYSGYRSSFTIKKIAEKNKLKKYLPSKEGNKKEAIAHFIRNVHKDHPRTLKKIIREILPISVERRHGQGNPILLEESNTLGEQLRLLDIDLIKEIKELNLPKSRPTIVPPPYDIQEILKKFSLHPYLMPDCQNLFIDGHINESVRKALEKYETYVQKKSGLTEIGPSLMSKAFTIKGPVIKLNSLRTESEQNEQQGFMYLSMGAMQWWRNTLSHGDEEQIPHHDALGRLFLVSNLLIRLDEC